MNAILLSLCTIIPSSLYVSKKQERVICKYESTIKEEAARNSLEPELLAAVIYVESAFRPSAVSSANACGLTQVVPKWTGGPETRNRKYSCRELKNPKVSIRVGAQILGFLIDHYASGNENKALCMYSTGSICLKNKDLHKRSRYVKKVRKVYDTIINHR